MGVPEHWVTIWKLLWEIMARLRPEGRSYRGRGDRIGDDWRVSVCGL